MPHGMHRALDHHLAPWQWDEVREYNAIHGSDSDSDESDAAGQAAA